MRYLIAALLIFPAVALGATRDITISWDQELKTVDGDALDKVDGFRLFTEGGVFLQLIPGNLRTATVRVNVPWGETCFKMRSFYTVDGVEYESTDSNVGACRTFTPGKPVPPTWR